MIDGIQWCHLSKALKADEQKVSQQLSSPPNTMWKCFSTFKIWTKGGVGNQQEKWNCQNFICSVLLQWMTEGEQISWLTIIGKTENAEERALNLSRYSGNFLPLNHTPVPPSILCQHSPWGYGHTGGTCRDLPSANSKNNLIWINISFKHQWVHVCTILWTNVPVFGFDLQSVKRKSIRSMSD